MTNRSNPPPAESAATTTSDAHSVWVSSVIPGLTVQVIDPMPPSLEGVDPGNERAHVQDGAASDAEPSGRESGSARRKGKALNRLTPKKDARSRHRRSRLLRLRETARDAAVTSEASRAAAGSGDHPIPPAEMAQAADARPAATSTTAELPAKSDSRPQSQVALAAAEPAAPSTPAPVPPAEGSAPEEGGAGTDSRSLDWFPDDDVSSDEVISISRSELGAAITTTPDMARQQTPSTSRRRPLPAPLPILPPPSVPGNSRRTTSTRSKSRQSAARATGARRHRGDQGLTDEHTEERYADWFRRVVLKNRWLSVFTTFYVHWLILLALGMMVVHGPENAAALLLNGTFSDPQPPAEETFDLTVPEPVPLDDPQASEQPDDADQAAQVSGAEMDERQPQLDESVMQGLLAGLTESESQPTPAVSQPATAAAAASPAPPRAVSEGSFSVWTEPSAPEAGEPYRIIVQIRLPPGMEQYDVSDLQGVVVGSDGYRKPIPGYLKGRLPVQDGYARLVIPIVSADEHVRDTVLIKSKRLKESQKLLIAFESGV